MCILKFWYICQHKSASFFQAGFGLQSSNTAITPISSKNTGKLAEKSEVCSQSAVKHGTSSWNVLWCNSPKRPNLLELLLPQAVLSWWCVIGDHHFNFKCSLNLNENYTMTLCKSLRGKYFTRSLYYIYRLYRKVFVVCPYRLTIRQVSLFNCNVNTSLFWLQTINYYTL